MSWFRLDDNSAYHPKVVAAQNEAWGAFCRAGAWSSALLTDGVIPWSVALTIAPRRVWLRLVAKGLCEEKSSDELLLHDYLDRNPSAAEVLAERERKQKNIRDYRERRKRIATAPVTGYVNGMQPGRNHGPVPVPVPIPIEEREKSGSSLQAAAPAAPDARPLPAPPSLREVADPAPVLAAEIKRHRVFASLDARALADAYTGRLMMYPQRIDDLVTAIRECATKSAGLPFTAEALQGKLVSFMHRAGGGGARGARAEGPEPSKVIESKEATPEDLAKVRAAQQRKLAKAAEDRKRRDEIAAKEKA